MSNLQGTNPHAWASIHLRRGAVQDRVGDQAAESVAQTCMESMESSTLRPKPQTPQILPP